MNSLKSLIGFLVLVVLAASWMPARMASSQADYPTKSIPAAGPWYVATGGNDTNDCLAPATPCATINAAIGKASAGDTVYVAEGTYSGVGDQVVLIDKDITLSGGWDGSFSNLTGTSILDGEAARFGLVVDFWVFATIDRFTIQRGLLGGIINYNEATIIVTNSTIRDTRSYQSTAVSSSGDLYLNNSVVSDNEGGGIASMDGAVTLNNSAVLNNKRRGIDNLSLASMTLNNSTISHNSGSGISNNGTLALNNSTISGNFSPEWTGGIMNSSGTVTTQNSIIAGNYSSSAPDCSGVITSAGYNLIGDTTGCNFNPGTGDLVGLNPNLGPLIGMPGSAQYHPLLFGSPAIDAGNPAGCTGSTGDLLTDQRGASRVGVCDVGAYEYTTAGAPTAVYAHNGSGQYAPPGSTFELPLVASVLDNLGTPVEGVTVTFSAPASGASGSFADTGGIDTTAQSVSNSLAQATPFEANGILGSYIVTATVNSIASEALFHLRNNPGALYVSATGDDGNTCFDPAFPCASFSETIEKAFPGMTINVAQGVYTSTQSDVLHIFKDISFSGGWDQDFSAQNGISILDGEGARRVIRVDENVNATLENFTIENGYSSEGAGIYNQGTLTMTLVTLRGNHARDNGYGGGVYNYSNLVMRDSLVQGNTAVFGGGIYNYFYGRLTLNSSSVIENTAFQLGGGIFNSYGSLLINNSTISLNSAGGGGGGVSNYSGSLHINNSTINLNSGGGVSSYETSFSMSSSTVSRNVGGGVNGNAQLKNTLLAGNTTFFGESGADCAGVITSEGYNLVANTEGCDYHAGTGDLVDTDARLSPFTDPSGVQLLRRDSPAIDAGNPSGCTDHEGNPLDTDQRGVARLGRCDIGAYEYDPAFDPISYISLPLAFQNLCPDFFDDFSDPSSGWYTGEDSEGRFEYLNGEYRVLVKPADFYWLLGAPACDQINYSVEVDARWAGNTGASYGLLFGIKGDFEQFYTFEVNTDYQEYALYRYDSTGWTELVPWTGAAAVINPGAQTNHLKAIRNGNDITLEINGTILGTWSESTITGDSGTGLIVSSYTDLANADAYFDNFRVTGLGSSLTAGTGSLDGEVQQPVQHVKVYRQGSWR